MPPPRPRRQQPVSDDDPGYEVVESPPPPVRKAKLLTPSKSKPRVELPPEDPGYEVVENPTPKLRKKPVVAVEEDDVDNEDDRDEEEARQTRRRKKKKSRRRSRDDDESTDTSQAWWVAPLVLILIGLGLSIVGAVGTAAGKKHAVEAIGTGIMLLAAFVQFIVTIPLSIFALIIGGKVCGIEYGSPMQAIANIGAIGAMMMGVDWMLEWAGLWYAAIHFITFIVGFSMFMSLFQLDTGEVWISLFFMKIVTVISFFAMVILIVAMQRKSSRFDDLQFDDTPAFNQKEDANFGKFKPQNGQRFNPDDDD